VAVLRAASPPSLQSSCCRHVRRILPTRQTLQLLYICMTICPGSTTLFGWWGIDAKNGFFTAAYSLKTKRVSQEAMARMPGAMAGLEDPEKDAFVSKNATSPSPKVTPSPSKSLRA